ncbi:MAG TPA: cache domain-containing protein [Candidatus Dormibacteraeota bacterium]|nr:cache domain-containing protein [Candidatus Dormibacteraeota bacterium]
MKSSFKYALVIIGLSALPLLVASALGILLARDEITRQATNSLESLASSQKARVEQAINQFKIIHDGIASRTQLRNSLEEFNRTHSPEAASSINRILTDAKTPFTDIKGVVLLGADGTAVSKLQDETIPSELYKSLYAKGKTSPALVASGESDNQVILHAAPVKRGETLLGVLVLSFLPDHLRSITHTDIGLGRTGETILGYRDGDGAILFPTRLQTTKETIRITKEQNTTTIQALEKKEVTLSSAKDYRGQDVLAVTKYIPEADWAIVTKKDRAEIFAPVSTFTAIYFFISIMLLTMAAALAWVIAPYILGAKNRS